MPPPRTARAFRAAACGGPITHLAVDYGGTLSNPRGAADPTLGIRPVLASAARTLRVLRTGLDLILMLSSNTTGPAQDRRPALAAAGVDALFSVVLQSHEIGVAKPAAGFFQRVQDVAGCAPAQVLVVGNNLLHDVIPAVAMGMPAVLVGLPPRRGLPAGAICIPDLDRLPAVLRGDTGHAR